MFARRYGVYGAVFGLVFPVVASAVEALTRYRDLAFWSGLARAQGSALLWIIDTAPVFLGLFASFAGREHDRLVSGFSAAAQDVFGSAQALVSSVSSLSSVSTQTAASVREVTATMGQLGQTATRAALTGETMIGLARESEHTSANGVLAAESSTGELVKLSVDVGALAQRVEALGAKVRDLFAVSSVVNYIAERSQRLAEAAGAAIQKGGASPASLAAVISEMRLHALDARRAATRITSLLEEVQKATVGAMSVAETGARRASQGAAVATATTDAIHKLAAALRESSQAGREIALVAQQQDHGIEQVLAAMNEVYRAAEEAMASTRQVASQARGLNDLAARLHTGVGPAGPPAPSGRGAGRARAARGPEGAAAEA
jgi:methyl-accepting chemotaxis protein